MIICSCSYEYGLIYPFKEISTAVPRGLSIPDDLARLVMSLQIQKNCRLYQSSFQPRCRLFFHRHGKLGNWFFTVASQNLKKKSMGFWAMDPCPKTTMGVKRAEIWNVFFFFAPKIDIPTWWTEVSFATHLINLAHQKKIMAIDGCCALRLLILFEAVSSAIP